jgi:hypothetical protein
MRVDMVPLSLGRNATAKMFLLTGQETRRENHLQGRIIPPNIAHGMEFVCDLGDGRRQERCVLPSASINTRQHHSSHPTTETVRCCALPIRQGRQLA